MKILILVFFILSFPGTSSYAFASDIVVIVNKNNSHMDNFSLQALQKIYMGKKKSWNGERINFWLPPFGSEAMNALVTKVFKKKNEGQVQKYYLVAIFQQKMTDMPFSATSTYDAVSKVAQTPGGIALVKASEILDKSGIKIVNVEGLE